MSLSVENKLQGTCVYPPSVGETGSEIRPRLAFFLRCSWWRCISVRLFYVFFKGCSFHDFSTEITCIILTFIMVWGVERCTYQLLVIYVIACGSTHNKQDLSRVCHWNEKYTRYYCFVQALLILLLRIGDTPTTININN